MAFKKSLVFVFIVVLPVVFLAFACDFGTDREICFSEGCMFCDDHDSCTFCGHDFCVECDEDTCRLLGGGAILHDADVHDSGLHDSGLHDASPSPDSGPNPGDAGADADDPSDGGLIDATPETGPEPDADDGCLHDADLSDGGPDSEPDGGCHCP